MRPSQVGLITDRPEVRLVATQALGNNTTVAPKNMSREELIEMGSSARFGRQYHSATGSGALRGNRQAVAEAVANWESRLRRH